MFKEKSWWIVILQQKRFWKLDRIKTFFKHLFLVLNNLFNLKEPCLRFYLPWSSIFYNNINNENNILNTIIKAENKKNKKNFKILKNDKTIINMKRLSVKIFYCVLYKYSSVFYKYSSVYYKNILLCIVKIFYCVLYKYSIVYCINILLCIVKIFCCVL